MSANGKLPYFPFYPADWLSDDHVIAMPRAVRGDYIQLLSLQWVSGNRLPVEEEAIARLLGYEPGRVEWDLVWHHLEPLFPRLRRARRNRKLDDLWRQAHGKHRKRVQAGRLGGQKKSSNARAMLEQCSSNQNQNQSQNQKKKKPPAADAAGPPSAAAARRTKAGFVRLGASLHQPTLGDDELGEVWTEWIAYLSQKPPKEWPVESTLKRQYAMLSGAGPAVAREAVEWMITGPQKNTISPRMLEVAADKLRGEGRGGAGDEDPERLKILKEMGLR